MRLRAPWRRRVVWWHRVGLQWLAGRTLSSRSSSKLAAYLFGNNSQQSLRLTAEQCPADGVCMEAFVLVQAMLPRRRFQQNTLSQRRLH